MQAANNFFHRKYSLYDADVETWMVILNIANKLQFKEVKELAVRELHMKKELPLVEKMVLYQHHQVDQRHLVPLFAELVSRDTALTLEESRILGPESTFLVYTARERLRSPSSEGDRSPLPPGLEEKDVYNSIERLLELDPGSTMEFQQLEANSTRKSVIPIYIIYISRIMRLQIIGLMDIIVQVRVTVIIPVGDEVVGPFNLAHQGLHLVGDPGH